MMNTQAERQHILQSLRSLKDKSTTLPLPALDREGKLDNASLEELLELFTRVLTAHNTSVINLAAITDLPEAVHDYLQNLVVDPLVFGGKNPLLNTLAWSRFGLQWQEQAFTGDGHVAIATADYAIADTGTVVVLSSEKNPTRNNFLAEHHIVVLQKETLLPYSEDVWEKITAEHDPLPRAINFISGPSSSADVGLKLEYGAHGPRSLAVFLY